MPPLPSHNSPTGPTRPTRSRALRAAFRGFAAMEKVGNKLPHPFWLFWILAGVVVLGTVYGRLTGTFSAARDTVAAMADGTRSMAPILVLFFAISQFLAYFKWTNIGDVLAVLGAETLRGLKLDGWTVLVGIAVLITLMNLLITSGSALWALAAPVFIPMLMLIGIAPETTQAVYRVADSVTNCVTPMSPYFVMALGFVQQYRKSAGIGTLASFMIPIAAVVRVVWIAFFVAWYLLGLPFGIN